MKQTPQRTRSYLEIGLSLLAGLLFAVGLALAGMTQPSKVLGFLDVAGEWDPSLVFVMVAAVSVYFAVNRFARRRAAPLVGERFHVPTGHQIDARLLIGASLFGVGWGLAGYCPGPGLTSLGAGSSAALTFVAAMVGGMLLFDQLTSRRGKRPSRESTTSRSSLPGDTVLGDRHS